MNVIGRLSVDCVLTACQLKNWKLLNDLQQQKKMKNKKKGYIGDRGLLLYIYYSDYIFWLTFDEHGIQEIICNFLEGF